MNEKEFAALIERCLSGRATKEETALVEKWLEQRSRKDPYGDLPDDAKELIRVKNFTALSARMAQRTGFGRSAGFFYKVAAAVVLLSVFSYLIFQFSRHSGVGETALLQAVSAGEGSKKVILSDSSIVWLKGNSSISYPEKFNGSGRNVELSGEALFEVAKNPDRPFIIEVGGLTARVLGTSFNIRASETDIEVLVLTGKVALSSRGNSEGLIVLENEKAVYNASANQMAKVRVSEDEKIIKVKGTQYSMKFHATPLQEIARRIEGKFDVRVTFSDERLGKCTITADFTDQSLERTLSMIAQTLEIEYEIDDTRVTLKGAGCD